MHNETPILMPDFISMIDKEMKMNAHDFFAYFPGAFFADEILFFSAAQTLFFENNAKPERSQLICENALLIYCSVKVHILIQKFEWQNDSYALEYAVLAGDYLSGRFIEKALDVKDFEQIQQWLAYLAKINEDLALMALQKTPLEERHLFHCQALMMQLQQFSGQPANAKEATELGSAFYDGSWDRYLHSVQGRNAQREKAMNKLALLYAAGAHQPIQQLAELETINHIWVSL